MPLDNPLFLVVVGSMTLVAATTDLLRFKVYNALTFPAIASGIVASTILGGPTGLASSLLGAAIGGSLLVVFFAIGGVGAGDVKLFAAIGAWLGPVATLDVFVASAVAAGAYALVLVFLRGGLAIVVTELVQIGQAMRSPSGWSRPPSRIDAEVLRPDRRSRLVPFAAMTCVGFFAIALIGGIL